MRSVLLHGEVGSLDEIGLGVGITMVLVVDALIILAVWRTNATQPTKIIWSLAIFVTHFLAWAAYGFARATGHLEPRDRPPS